MINTDRPRLCLAVFCLGALCTPAHAAGGDPNPVRIEIGYTADDNVNRAADTKQKLSDDIFSASLSQSAIFPLTDRTRVVVTGLLTAEKLRRLVGLDRISLGIQGEFQYRTSGEFFAPTFGFVGRAWLDEYNAGMRSGQRYSVGANLRQALTDRIHFFGALAANSRNADSAVFDGRDYAARFNLDYSLSRDATLYLGGEYRSGDTVTSAPDSAAYESIAKADAPDDAYAHRGLVAYRYEAKTVLWTLGYNRRLGPNDSIDLWWRRADSTPTATGPLGTSRYSANQYSIAYLIRF
jgi:hypothetical protein